MILSKWGKEVSVEVVIHLLVVSHQDPIGETNSNKTMEKTLLEASLNFD